MLYFEGTFRDDGPNGDNCKIYYTKGLNKKIQYEGTMTAGVKNGCGVLFTEEGHKSYEGGFLDNKFHGSECKLFHRDGQVAYIGQISNGVKSGYGKEYFSNGVLCYQGDFGDDQKIAEDEC